MDNFVAVNTSKNSIVNQSLNCMHNHLADPKGHPRNVTGILVLMGAPGLGPMGRECSLVQKLLTFTNLDHPVFVFADWCR